MGEASTGTRHRWAAVGLAIAGVIVFVWGFILKTFACFMVTDPACGAEATAKAVPVVLLGIALIVVAFWVGFRRGRGGDPGA